MNQIIEDNIKIEDMIYEIRGKQVMLDSDLARLYECKSGTKEINQAVKNNMDKFPERFSWVLSYDEYKNLRSKFLTSSPGSKHGGRRYNPRVFTEQGVAMLATILKTKVATKVSIEIMDAFVAIRYFIKNNLLDQKYINNIVLENRENIKEVKKDVKLLQEAFNKLEEKGINNKIYFNGQIFDAYSKIYEIFNKTKNELVIIDGYADNTVLDIIKRLKVKVVIITKKNNLLTNQDVEKYKKQYHNLKVIYNNTFHDRYFILDSKIIYHCGASINRIGYKTFCINLISDENMVNSLLDNINMII